MTDYDEGDWRIATATVEPYDGTTTAVLTVYRPGLANLTPGLSHVDDDPEAGQRTYTAAAYELPAGEIVELWVFTNTGKGKQRDVILVAPGPELADTTPVYATTADYAAWLRAAPPAGSRRALREASRKVDEMLETAVYAVDADELPTDPAVAAALRDATCAQAEYDRGRGDEYGTDAATAYTQVGIGSVNLGRAAAAAGTGAGAGRYAPKALTILRQAGLTGLGPLYY